MDPLTLRPAIVSEPGVAALVAAHFELMRASSPEESCHVMPADSLEQEGVFLIAAEKDGEVAGIGGLKDIGAGHFEIKSMHTAKAARGSGIAKAVLDGLLAQARKLNANKVSLETGSAELFVPARALYLAAGFRTCGPFGTYAEDPLSVFMTLDF